MASRLANIFAISGRPVLNAQLGEQITFTLLGGSAVTIPLAIVKRGEAVYEDGSSGKIISMDATITINKDDVVSLLGTTVDALIIGFVGSKAAIDSLEFGVEGIRKTADGSAEMYARYTDDKARQKFSHSWKRG